MVTFVESSLLAHRRLLPAFQTKLEPGLEIARDSRQQTQNCCSHATTVTWARLLI